MSLPTPEAPFFPNQLPLHSRFYEIEHAVERYSIVNFTEAESPEGARHLWRIQGECYVAQGFLYDNALYSDGPEAGCIHEDIDRSRGPNVIYYHASPKRKIEDRADEGGLRIADILQGESLEDLISFRHSRASLLPDVEDQLRRHAENRPVREVAAMSHTKDTDGRPSFELIRYIIQQAIKAKTDELWLITFVPNAYEKISSSFSPATVQIVGEDISINDGSGRISDTLKLTPVIIEPCRVPDQMLEYISKTDIEPSEKNKVTRTLLFLLDGLDDQDLSREVRDFKHAIEATRKVCA